MCIRDRGTPLSILSVLIGDWKAAPRLAKDREVQEDLALSLIHI